MIFEKAWEIAKMGYSGMPLDETSAYYEAIRERLGLGDPFDTGLQRRVFNIPGQPNFVAKVANRDNSDSPYEFEGLSSDSGHWEDYIYPSLARYVPNTAERFLVPAETMGLEENIAHVVRQPRVNVHPRIPYEEFDPKAEAFYNDFLESARSEVSGLSLGAQYGDKIRRDIMREIKDFLNEQDYGYGNFTDDMKLLDYYAPYIKPGRVFRR